MSNFIQLFVLENGVERPATPTEAALIGMIKDAYLVGYDNGYNDDIIDLGLDAPAASDLYINMLMENPNQSAVPFRQIETQ